MLLSAVLTSVCCSKDIVISSEDVILDTSDIGFDRVLDISGNFFFLRFQNRVLIIWTLGNGRKREALGTAVVFMFRYTPSYLPLLNIS